MITQNNDANNIMIKNLSNVELEEELSDYLVKIFADFHEKCANDVNIRIGKKEYNLLSNIHKPMMTLLLFLTYNNSIFEEQFIEEKNTFIHKYRGILVSPSKYNDFMNHGDSYRYVLSNIVSSLRKEKIEAIYDDPESSIFVYNPSIIQKLFRLTSEENVNELSYILPFFASLQESMDENIHGDLFSFFYNDFYLLVEEQHFLHDVYGYLTILAILHPCMREEFKKDFIHDYKESLKSDYTNSTYYNNQLHSRHFPKYNLRLINQVFTKENSTTIMFARAANDAFRKSNNEVVKQNSIANKQNYSEMRKMYNIAFYYTLMKTMSPSDVLETGIVEDRLNQYPLYFNYVMVEENLKNDTNIPENVKDDAITKIEIMSILKNIWLYDTQAIKDFKKFEQEIDVESFLIDVDSPIMSHHQTNLRITELYFITLIRKLPLTDHTVPATWRVESILSMLEDDVRKFALEQSKAILKYREEESNFF